MNFTIEENPEITFSYPSKETVTDIFFTRDKTNRLYFLFRKDTDIRISRWRTNKKALIQMIGNVSSEYQFADVKKVSITIAGFI